MSESQVQTKQSLDNVYAFIRSYVTEHGYPPSLREISRACYLGRSTALRYLDKLEAQGKIKRQPNKARSIHLLEKI